MRTERRRASVSLTRAMPKLKLGTSAAIALLMFLVIAGAALYEAVPMGLPEPVPASAPPTEFSSARALAHVRAIAQKPHPMGSPENAAVRDYLVEQLTALGLKPVVRKATAANCCFYGGSAAVVGRPENVVARLEGTARGGKAFLVVAHYDSVPTGPGASDDGAGVAAMLETIRALKAGSPLRNDVIFLFTDGEEPGMLGSRAFVENHPWAKDVGAVLNLEARGNTGAARLFETSDDNGWLIREFARAVPYPFGNSGDAAGYKLTGSDTDLSVFMDAGRAGMNVAYARGITHYHTRLDTVEELDERSLQHLGSYVLALTRQFGDTDLDHPKAPQEVYFSLAGSVVHYPQGWVIPLMVLVALLFVGIVALGFRRRQLSVGGIALGFLALLASVIMTALGVYLVWTLIRALHPGGVWALQYKAPLFWVGFAGLTVAITAALYVGFREKIRANDLAVGALLWWLLFTVLMSAFFPPASFVYTWPLLFSLLGLGAVFALGDQPASPWYPFAALVLSAIPAVLVFAPAVYGVSLIQGLLPMAAMPAFAGMITLLMGLLVPHLGLIAKPNKWILPGAAMALGVVLLVVGSLTAGFDVRYPKPNNIFYALNADTHTAIWVSYDDAPDAWTAQFLGANPQKGPVTDYVDASRPLLHSKAPSVPLEAPDVKLLDDSTSDGIRTLRVRITPPPGANLLTLTANTKAQIVDMTIDGERVPTDIRGDGGKPMRTLRYWSPPSGGIELTLEVKGTEPLTLTARSTTPGLPAIPGKSYRDRPPDTMPVHSLGENRTLVSKSFTFAGRS